MTPCAEELGVVYDVCVKSSCVNMLFIMSVKDLLVIDSRAKDKSAKAPLEYTGVVKGGKTG
jgi:hypothetical protein